VYTHSFDPAKLGKLVNSAPELFARTKAELLAFAAFLEHYRVDSKGSSSNTSILCVFVSIFALYSGVDVHCVQYFNYVFF
jgi:hypothetical protein